MTWPCFETKYLGRANLWIIFGTHFIFEVKYSNKSARAHLEPLKEQLDGTTSFHIKVAWCNANFCLITAPQTRLATLFALESFLPRGSWFPSSLDEVKLARLIRYPFSLKKTPRCYTTRSLTISSKLSILALWIL